MSDNFYNGTKLLSLNDINGNKPELYLSTSNRTGGKTTYFNRLLFNKFLRGDGKFALLYRFNYELDSVAETYFKDIGSLFFPQYTIRAEKRCKGIFAELYACKKSIEGDLGESCGYAISLNSADQIKKKSHFFSDVQRMFMDEFQSETNNYCQDEVTKFISVHTSIARGQGKQYRYVPVYMASNPVSLINPYYTAMGISSRLKDDTKFLRGDGFVLEQGFNESASIAQQESGFNKAFASQSYIAYSTQAVYLNDNKAFIEKPFGRGRYLATLRYEGKEYALREYAEAGVIYCDDHDDETFKYKISVTTDDHNVNYVMLKRNDMFITNMRFFFNKGCFRFKDLKCKECVMKMLSY